jgi:hypothetical protein
VRVERARTPPIHWRGGSSPAVVGVHGYWGFDEDALPHGDFLVPATLVTPLTVYVVDVGSLPSRPPRVNGPSSTYTLAEGPYAPALMANLAPLGAYKLLGPAVSEIGGTIVGLEDIAGAEARRLSEQIQSAPTWEECGRLLDHFLLNRAAHGPQPSPEVRHASHLLVRSGGRDTIRGDRAPGGLEPQAPHHRGSSSRSAWHPTSRPGS